MELMCNERLLPDNNCFAERDSVLFDDIRVLKNLLATETMYLPNCYYFTNLQKDIKPFMRQVVTVWMLEVCDEQHCENQVFPLAVNFMDRFLCVCSLPKRRLQLLSAVCLLLASKIRQCNALSIDLLCYYSDNSFSPDDMRRFEMLVLSKLEWKMSAVTGYDFVDHLLERIHWSRSNPQVRRHAHTLLSLCYTELDFMMMKSSLLASASVLAAGNGLKLADNETVLKSICSLTGCNEDDVTRSALMIDKIVKSQFNSLPNPSVISPSSSIQASNIQNPPKSVSPPPQQQLPLTSNTQPGTPTDIQEILF